MQQNRKEFLPVMISALEHYAYCPRQCALIYLEQTYDENIYTLRGSLLHEKVHQVESCVERGVQVERALRLWCERLGLVGMADLVEFHPDGRVFPVEYKRGEKGEKAHDEIQLCAQAICLEEMLGKKIEHAAIYYHSSRRRRQVRLTRKLREMVEETVAQVREMLVSGKLPSPVADSRCRRCSLRESCMPQLGNQKRLKAMARELFVVEEHFSE